MKDKDTLKVNLSLMFLSYYNLFYLIIISFIYIIFKYLGGPNLVNKIHTTCNSVYCGNYKKGLCIIFSSYESKVNVNLDYGVVN